MIAPEDGSMKHEYRFFMLPEEIAEPGDTLNENVEAVEMWINSLAQDGWELVTTFSSHVIERNILFRRQDD